MAIKLTMTSKDGYLLAKGVGKVSTVKETLEYNIQMVEEAERTGLTRMLVDERDIEFNLDFHDVLKVVDYWDKKMLPLQGFRVASLPSPIVLNPQEGYETAANNRSMLYRVFTDEGEALSWLLQEESLSSTG